MTIIAGLAGGIALVTLILWLMIRTGGTHARRSTSSAGDGGYWGISDSCDAGGGDCGGDGGGGGD